MKYTIFVLVIIALSACRKETVVPDSTKTGTLSIQFDNIAGDRNLQLGTGVYTNAAGEKFSVDMLKYFISNISLKNTSGETYTVPQDSSYFLVSEENGTSQFVKVRVPEGEYTSLNFILGVDSLRSTMDISRRTGVLDPSAGMDDGMYWGWNSGYIFFKMEGTSAAAPLDASGQHKFRYHIGGFGGYNAVTFNNIKTITVDLSAAGTAKVVAGRTPNIHLMADILKAFNGSTNISLAEWSTIMVSDYSINVANNYQKMFSHDHTEN